MLRGIRKVSSKRSGGLFELPSAATDSVQPRRGGDQQRPRVKRVRRNRCACKEWVGEEAGREEGEEGGGGRAGGGRCCLPSPSRSRRRCVGGVRPGVQSARRKRRGERAARQRWPSSSPSVASPPPPPPSSSSSSVVLKAKPRQGSSSRNSLRSRSAHRVSVL